MESSQQQVTPTTPVSQPVLQEPKKCKHMPAIIILVVLLICSCAFGGFELWQGLQKDSEIAKLKENEKPQDTPTQSDDSNVIESGEAISVNGAEGILERYIGEGNRVKAYGLIAFYNTFVADLNRQQKAFLTYSSIGDSNKGNIDCVSEWYEKGLCTGKRISYDSMSEKYKSLFGNYGSIEKKNYTFQNFFYLVYDDGIEAYREYILPGGGTTPVEATHKVISVEKSNDDMVVSLVFAELNTDVEVPSGICGPTPLSGGLGVTNEALDEMVSSMAIYKFTLSPYNDTYVLTGITKEK